MAGTTAPAGCGSGLDPNHPTARARRAARAHTPPSRLPPPTPRPAAPPRAGRDCIDGRCGAGMAAFAARAVASHILVSSSQSPPGPAGGAPDGCWLRLLDRSAVHRCRTELLQIATQDATIHLSALAPPPVPNRDRSLNRCGMDGDGHIN